MLDNTTIIVRTIYDIANTRMGNNGEYAREFPVQNKGSQRPFVSNRDYSLDGERKLLLLACAFLIFPSKGDRKVTDLSM